MKIKNARDFWAGLMFIGFGAGFMAVAQNYAMGSAVRMGPAYFPTALGGLLVLLGLVVFIRSLFGKAGDGSLPPFFLKPLFIILGAVVLFGVLLKPLGLVIAIVVLIGGSAYGAQEIKAKDTLAFTGYLAIAAAVTAPTLWISDWLGGLLAKILGVIGIDLPKTLAMVGLEILVPTVLLIVLARYKLISALPRQLAALAYVLTVGSIAVFIHGLGLPLDLWPQWGGN
jgi:hypothetical protein